MRFEEISEPSIHPAEAPLLAGAKSPSPKHNYIKGKGNAKRDIT
jgi:hypothetical protein